VGGLSVGSEGVDIRLNNETIVKNLYALRTRPDIVILVISGFLLLMSTGAQAYLSYGFQMKHLPAANGFLLLILSTLSWVSFFTALVIVISGYRICVSINSVTKKLHDISETHSYDNRLKSHAYPPYKNLVEELNELIERLEHGNKRIDEMSEVIDQREHENQLLWLEIEHNLCLAKEEAETDGLTQIYNRKSIEERLSGELDNAANTKKPLSVLMADLDHFKRVNDTFGHKVGDEVLKIFADTLKDSIRSDDIPARYGGEEFIIVLPHTPAAAALKIAGRINRSFKDAVDKSLGSVHSGLKCTVSIGIADYPTCASEKGKLISAADIALYRAKEKGRNKIIYYNDIHKKLEKSA
jgi:diguanylate cyclase (GGDEF)-like protein